MNGWCSKSRLLLEEADGGRKVENERRHTLRQMVVVEEMLRVADMFVSCQGEGILPLS